MFWLPPIHVKHPAAPNLCTCCRQPRGLLEGQTPKSRTKHLLLQSLHPLTPKIPRVSQDPFRRVSVKGSCLTPRNTGTFSRSARVPPVRDAHSAPSSQQQGQPGSSPQPPGRSIWGTHHLILRLCPPSRALHVGLKSRHPRLPQPHCPSPLKDL